MEQNFDIITEDIENIILNTKYHDKTLREWIEILPTRVMILEISKNAVKMSGWIILVKCLFRLFFGI